MLRRHFLQGCLTVAGGLACGPLDALLAFAPPSDNASRHIASTLRRAGLLDALEMCDARVLGGAVYALSREIIPSKIQVMVAEDRFVEAARLLDRPEIELWSDQFSCRNGNAARFSSLGYLARVESGRPLGLFCHQKLSYAARSRSLHDAARWLATPQLELSREAQLPGDDASQRELLLLAGREAALFGLAWSPALMMMKQNLLVRPVTCPVEAQRLLALLHENTSDAFSRECLDSPLGNSLAGRPAPVADYYLDA